MDVAVGQHVNVSAAGLVEVLAPGGGRVRDRGRHRHADAEHLVAGGDAAGRPVTDDDAGRAGAHQVQGGAVIEHAARHHRHVQPEMNVLRFSGSPSCATRSAEMMVPWMTSRSMPAATSAGSTPGRSAGSPAPPWSPRPRGWSRTAAPSRSGSIGAECSCCSRRIAAAGSAPFPRPRPPGRSWPPRRRAADQPLAVEHAEPAEPAHLDRELRRHQRVGRMGHHRDLEAVGVELPAVDTSFDDLVRRDGTMLMSSSSSATGGSAHPDFDHVAHAGTSAQRV